MIGLVAGGLIGALFGAIQETAWRRNQKQEEAGAFKSGWGVMPGSMRRVAGLMFALALVQYVCPMLFVDGTQWMVSAGVVFCYGWLLFRRLREKRMLAA